MEDETKDGVLEMLEDLYVISQHAEEYEVQPSLRMRRKQSPTRRHSLTRTIQMRQKRRCPGTVRMWKNFWSF